MDLRLLALPTLIAIPAALLLVLTWGADALTRLAARRVATRPRFSPAERSQLRALRERYRREPPER